MNQITSQPHYMQSEAFASYMEHLHWHASRVGKGQTQAFAFTRTLPLLGTVVKVPKATYPFALTDLERLVAGKRPLFIRLEPNIAVGSVTPAITKALHDHGFGPTWNSGELATIQVDLTVPEERLFTSIARENTRRNIRFAQKQKLVVEQSANLEEFFVAHQSTGKAKHFWTPGKAELTAFWQAFQADNQATILTIRSPKGSLLAAVMLVLYQGIAYYRYVAATDQGYALRAPSLLVWGCWLLAKKAKCQAFDFYGIYDDRLPTRSWQGFSHFKRGFSSNVIQFALPQAKYYPPFGPLVRFADRF